MQKIILPILLFLATALLAQPAAKKCRHDMALQNRMEKNPEIVEQLLELENFTQQWISENQNQTQLRAVITIPVVVHIVYLEDEENFSDLEIEAQIDGLTADFRMLNNNVSSIPPVFRPLAADVEIEFCLATIDPLGNVTNGIVRRKTNIENIGTATFNENTPNEQRRICYQTLGGSDAWNTDDYLNIWVGQFRDNFLGEATFPGTVSSKEDGVYIDPDFFGFFCAQNNDFYLGRTLTHEVGHYFNLLHIWGEDLGCQYDDFVDDTPLQEGPYNNCPTYPQSSCDSEDMFMNFMDYVDDQCMSMFTQGQKMRMLAALHGPRKTLLDSKGCDWILPTNKTLNADQVTIFPNPAANCVHIDLDVENALPVQMQIINSQGQVISDSEVFVQDLRSVDISYLPNGIYFIYFQIGNSFASKKLVVDK